MFVVANTVAAGVLWWHRTRPVLTFAIILTIFLASATCTGTAGNGGLTLPLWFSVFALTAYAPLPRAAIAIGVGWPACWAVKVLLSIRSGQTLSGPELALAFFVDVGFYFVACAALGWGFRIQAEKAREAEERSRILEDHARAVRSEAVATERNRLARDLHDLAAHELMDALLAIRALQVSDPDPMLAEIEERASRALKNMRTVVRTLRSEGDPQDPTSSDQLPLAEAAAAAMESFQRKRGVELRSEIAIGSPVDDAGASTVLSILTETVLNADRHAPGAPISVRLIGDAEDILLDVRNPIAPLPRNEAESTHYGLIGAQERARLLGGTFTAGPTRDGNWVAILRLPRTSAPEEQDHTP